MACLHQVDGEEDKTRKTASLKRAMRRARCDLNITFTPLDDGKKDATALIEQARGQLNGGQYRNIEGKV